MDGRPSLPQAGGYLDQDAELMWAFEVLDEAHEHLKDLQEKRAEVQAAAKKLAQQGPLIG